MKQMIDKVIAWSTLWMLACLSPAAMAQVGPFTGEAQVGMGGAQSADMFAPVTVPVNIDLSTVTAYDVDSNPVPAALGEYRLVITYDGSMLEPQLSGGQVPGGVSTEFSAPVSANWVADPYRSLLVLQAAQTSIDQPAGLVNVAQIPFLVKGEGGTSAEVSVIVQDVRTPLARVGVSQASVIGGVRLPFVTGATQIAINVPATAPFDADADGLPDAWELARGLDPGNAADALGDTDADGFSVLQEFRAGSDITTPASAPVGVAGLSYVPFSDEFDDAIHSDRWTIASETPLAIYSFTEAADELAASLQLPSTSCNNIKLASYADVDVTNAVLATTLTMDAGGVLILGLQQGLSLSHRVEVHLDASQQQARLQSWVNNVLSSEQVLDLAASLFAAPIDVRVIKTADSYQLYVNNIDIGNLTNASLGNLGIKPYLGLRSCMMDMQALDSRLQRIEILLDRDGDGLPDRQEDANANGVLDSGETDPLLADDSDGDGRFDGFDNCPNLPNADQLDANNNGIGDACEPMPPVITGVWPGAGTAGDSLSVFVFGNHFTVDGSTEVYFNGIRQFLVAPVSNEMLIVRVQVDPSLYGNVTVVTPNGSIDSGTQFGVPATGLQLTGVWPGNLVSGEATSVFLFGNGFTTDGLTEVYFNGVRQFLIAPVSSEMLIVRLGAPTSALSGPVTVVVPGVGSVSSGQDLVVSP